MKDHKLEKREIGNPDDYSPAVYAELLIEKSSDLINPYISNESWYDEGPDYYVVGWRPMTDEEKQKAKEQRKKERAAEKARKDKIVQDRYELYQSLKEEFEQE